MLPGHWGHAAAPGLPQSELHLQQAQRTCSHAGIGTDTWRVKYKLGGSCHGEIEWIPRSWIPNKTEFILDLTSYAILRSFKYADVPRPGRKGAREVLSREGWTRISASGKWRTCCLRAEQGVQGNAWGKLNEHFKYLAENHATACMQLQVDQTVHRRLVGLHIFGTAPFKCVSLCMAQQCFRATHTH